MTRDRKNSPERRRAGRRNCFKLENRKWKIENRFRMAVVSIPFSILHSPFSSAQDDL
jgi:hypothetical protein